MLAASGPARTTGPAGADWPPKAFSRWFLSLKQAVGGEHGAEDSGNKARGWLSQVPGKGRLEGGVGSLRVKGLGTSRVPGGPGNPKPRPGQEPLTLTWEPTDIILPLAHLPPCPPQPPVLSVKSNRKLPPHPTHRMVEGEGLPVCALQQVPRDLNSQKLGTTGRSLQCYGREACLKRLPTACSQLCDTLGKKRDSDRIGRARRAQERAARPTAGLGRH